MKISKLLNKKNLLFFIFFLNFSNSVATEPVDIWNIDKTKNKSEQTNQSTTSTTEEISEKTISIYDLNNQNANSQNEVLLETNLENKNLLYGLYDPDENNLSIEMWNSTDGVEIKNIFNKIDSKKLSKDALDILEVALLTNSNTPIKNINKKEYYDIQKKFLIKKNDMELIKLFVEKNPKFFFNDELIKYYANHYLSEANIKKSCEIFDTLNDVTLIDNYVSKIKIYCLINANKIDQALLIYDLKKEMGFKDDFFEKKFLSSLDLKKRVMKFQTKIY